MNRIENVWNITKNEIGNQMLCTKGDIWKRKCRAWYSIAANVLENFTIQYQGELQILLKQREVQRNIELMM